MRFGNSCLIEGHPLDRTKGTFLQGSGDTSEAAFILHYLQLCSTIVWLMSLCATVAGKGGGGVRILISPKQRLKPGLLKQNICSIIRPFHPTWKRRENHDQP